jgi:hypothetical protein
VRAGRKWRHLSIPTSTSESIRQSWQENNGTLGDLNPGYGTIITDANNSSFIANGFDAYSPGGPGMKIFDSSSQLFQGITNTFVPINTYRSYMTFVRGDRSCLNTNSRNFPTTLRTYGPLKQGSQPPIAIPANKYVDIGNPFASPVDMNRIEKSGVQEFIWIWDPMLSGSYGLGGYQIFSSINGQYYATPGGGSYPTAGTPINTIQSGQAFFIRGDVNGGQVQFHEKSKGAGNIQVFKTSSLPSLVRISINTVINSQSQLADGIMAMFGIEYSNKVDDADGLKFKNLGLNVALKRENKLLAVERRENIKASDSLHLEITGFRIQKYQLIIEMSEMGNQCGAAFLIDKFKKKKYPLKLDATNLIEFDIENIQGSYASDRFFIIFHGSAANIATKAKSIIPESQAKETNLKNELSVFPNPVSGEFMQILIPANITGKLSLTINNLNGLKIYQLDNITIDDSRKVSIPANKIPAGIYYLTLFTENGNKFSRKVIFTGE